MFKARRPLNSPLIYEFCIQRIISTVRYRTRSTQIRLYCKAVDCTVQLMTVLYSSRLCCTALDCTVAAVQLSIVLYNYDLWQCRQCCTVLDCAVYDFQVSTELYGCRLCCIQLSTVMFSSRSTVLTVLYSSRRYSLCCTALDCAVYDSLSLQSVL